MGINGEGTGFYQKTLVLFQAPSRNEDIYCQVTSVNNYIEAKLLEVNKKI